MSNSTHLLFVVGKDKADSELQKVMQQHLHPVKH